MDDWARLFAGLHHSTTPRAPFAWYFMRTASPVFYNMMNDITFLQFVYMYQELYHAPIFDPVLNICGDFSSGLT